MPKSPISLGVLLILAYVIIRVAHFYPRWEKPGTEATLTWDVYGYYLYLPAIFIYDDLTELKFQEEIFETYNPSGSYYHSHQMEDGKQSLRYPMGVCFFYLPFFLLAHLFASISPDFLADGFSLPYQFAISMASVIYSILGLAVLRKVLLKYFSDGATALTLALLVLGTVLLNYAAIDGGMTHSYLFALYAAVLWLTIRWHESPHWLTALGLGASIGLAGLTRPTDALLVIVPVLWGIENRETFLQKWQLIRKHWWQFVIAGAAMGAVGSLQLLYWKLTTGHFIFYSYGDIGFNFRDPKIIKGLFSYRKGLVMYSPVMLIALLGIYAHFKRHKTSFLAIWAYMLVALYVLFSWSIWWYGGGLGGRPLVQTFALLAFPMAAFVSWVMEQKRWIAWPIYGLLIMGTEINLNFHWQSHGGNNPYWMADGLFRPYYQRVVGRTHFDRYDTRFFEVRSELKDLDGWKLTPLHQDGFEDDSTLIRSQGRFFEGEFSLMLTPEQEFSPKYEAKLGDIGAEPGDWIRVSVQFYFEKYPPVFWDYAQFTLMFLDGDRVIKATPARMHRIGQPGKWTEYEYEMRVPSKTKPEDIVRAYIWHPQAKTPLWLDDFKVSLIEPAQD